jgi:small-conductance mechanosensitive channel/CRP-like cAMP-binding protein
MIAGFALFAVMLALRAASRNRHVRARLLASAVVSFGYAVLAILLGSGRISPELQAQLRVVQPLLVAFGVINSLVALIINPWKADRPPDRFPTIVQDAIVISLFALTATFLLQEKIFAATAAGAVVIGLALQDTLGNLFAGLAIQIEKPFRVGHWVQIAGIDGLVSEVTWRATKVRTKAGNFVVVPNSKLSDDIIVNYSEPTLDTRIEVNVGVTYDVAPNDVKRSIQRALAADPLLRFTREPEVLIDDFGNSAIVYRIRVWITQFDADERTRDRIRSALYYGFKRDTIEIPYPIQVEYQRETVNGPPIAFERAERVIRGVPVFGALSAEDQAELARAGRYELYAAGEQIVRQGAEGTSMFVLLSGEVVVRLDGGQEVARIGPGGYFGEMSLLTGAPRNATVAATVDTELLELTLDAFRKFVLANPEAVEQIGAAVAKRRAELEERRAAGTAAAPVEPPQTLINRIRRFLFRET